MTFHELQKKLKRANLNKPMQEKNNFVKPVAQQVSPEVAKAFIEKLNNFRANAKTQDEIKSEAKAITAVVEPSKDMDDAKTVVAEVKVVDVVETDVATETEPVEDSVEKADSLEKAPAKKSTAKKSTAKKSTTKKSTTKKSATKQANKE